MARMLNRFVPPCRAGGKTYSAPALITGRPVGSAIRTFLRDRRKARFRIYEPIVLKLKRKSRALRFVDICDGAGKKAVPLPRSPAIR